MAWTRPLHSKMRVNRAGEALAQGIASEEDLDVIGNWRSSHSFPLLTQRITLHSRAMKIDPTAIVAQRLKRLSSIALKLSLQPHMKLAQMQDIAGCRAVLQTAAQVDGLVTLFEESTAKNPKQRAEFCEKYDYVIAPKADGYRSVHLVYKYRSKAKEREIHNGQRVEIQIRTRLQHAWATADETVSTFTLQKLKYGIGDPGWKRFFALSASAIAFDERRALVAGAPLDPTELREELKSLYSKLQVEPILIGSATAARHIEDRLQQEKASSYLLILDVTARRLRVVPYGRGESDKASKEYLEEERRSESDSHKQVVLVSVRSLSDLQKAYPNYFLDTTKFVNFVRRFVVGRA